MAPAAMLATIIMQISSQLGTLSPRRIMHAAVARPPASTCPSAPRFQKRILNAGVTARETHNKMAIFWHRIQIFRLVPKAPSNMVMYTWMGSSPVISVVATAHTTKARMMAAPRMPHA